ncbi:MAG: DJ-1 family glyoxalase III [Bacillota bacterium]
MAKIMIPLADGLEEIEAISNIDVLRRAGIEVITASIGNNLEVNGDHGIIIMADDNIDNIKSEEIDGIILPGGMPGAENLKNNENLIKLIQKVNKKNGLIAAICAAPIVLEAAGVIQNKNATSYPGFDEQMKSCNYQEKRVVKDGNIITGRGPGVALEFALKIVEYLLSKGKAREIKENMLAK